MDRKSDCIGIYAEGRLRFDDDLPKEISKTWDFSSFLKGKDIEYAKFYCGGTALKDACPEHIKEDWNSICARMRAFLRSFDHSQICLNEHCFYDLVPQRFLMEYFDLKNEITESVFKTHLRPDNHDFLVSVAEVLSDVSFQRLNINKEALRSELVTARGRDTWKKIDKHPYVRYNLFGAKTGRLTTNRNSFPILNLDKKYRSVLKPNNDWFIELDFNAAELRTLLALCGSEQPANDIHEWNIKNLFDGTESREEAKKRVFSWLYNPASEDKLLNEVYDRDAVVEKYFNGAHVKTVFDRKIDVDKRRALNYIIQSTTSDLFLDRLVRIYSMLSDRPSSIAFFIHDSLVIDLADSDKSLLPQIIEEFSNTKLGKFKANVSAGRDFGDMKEIK